MGFFDDAKTLRQLDNEISEAKKELEKILKEKGKPDPSWLLRSQDENEQKKRVEIAEIRKQIEFAKISPETFANIKIATSTICEKFEVIDTVFAIDVHKDSLFGGLFGGGAADPFSVFSGVNEILRKQCVHLGGDAIINCEFNWETGVTSEVLGISIPGFSRKLHMIYAYGTAVRLIK